MDCASTLQPKRTRTPRSRQTLSSESCSCIVVHLRTSTVAKMDGSMTLMPSSIKSASTQSQRCSTCRRLKPSRASKTSTRAPSSASSIAVRRPTGPAPTMATATTARRFGCLVAAATEAARATRALRSVFARCGNLSMSFSASLVMLRSFSMPSIVVRVLYAPSASTAEDAAMSFSSAAAGLSASTTVAAMVSDTSGASFGSSDARDFLAASIFCTSFISSEAVLLFFTGVSTGADERRFANAFSSSFMQRPVT